MKKYDDIRRHLSARGYCKGRMELVDTIQKGIILVDCSIYVGDDEATLPGNDDNEDNGLLVDAVLIC